DLKGGKDLIQPITYRKKTTQWIIDRVKIDRIMLIRGPRYSGKTSMCELLERHLKEIITTNDQVISISNLLFDDNYRSYDEFLNVNTGRTLKDWQNSFPNGHIYIIMDETQKTYSSYKCSGFWYW